MQTSPEPLFMPSPDKSPLNGLAWAGLALFASMGAAHAQGEGKAMQLTVRPSGFERNDSKERQERLLKRMEQSDHMIRSICINCGDQWKHQIYAPFDPLASLKPSSRTSDQTGN
jgi:hypothetical protein